MSTSNAMTNVATLRNGLTGPVLGGITIGSITIDQSTANQRVVYSSTNPAGWNTGVGRMTVDFELTSNGYFAANPNSHFAISLRNTTSVIATAVRGQGVALGNATGFTQPVDLNPTPVIETWMNGLTGSGAPADNFVWANSETARSLGFKDGVAYKFNISATKANDGNRYIRYRVWSRQSTTQQWRAEVDSGDVLDHNIWADLTQQGLVFGYVFASNLTAWSIAITNCRVIWGPAENSVPDQTIKLSRYGAQLEGDLKFIGAARRALVYTDTGSDLSQWTAFRTSGTNLGTTVLALPNGTSTSANFAATNNATSSSTYQIATFGMSGSTALLETFHKGVSNPDLGINIGAGNRVATFNALGLKILGATRYIGQPINSYNYVSNFGGSYASSFSAGTVFDMENICTTGTIAAYLGGTYNASNIENVLRPIYCLFSVLKADLTSKAIL